jgi:hypothetical protein
MCGLARDDDDYDLREDVAELFGRHVEDPIEVDGGGNDAAGGEEEEGEDDNDDKRSRPSTSAVWLDFKKLFKKGPKVRRSGMPLTASTAIKSTLLSLVVALVTSLVIGINVLRGVRKLT